MKEYVSSKIYGKNLPMPWYSLDDCYNESFKNNEEYILNQIFENKKSVQYTFDKNGFRKSNGLDSELWFFGCSFTFGEAVDFEQTFSYLVSKSLNKSFYNFGTVGASINLIARLLFKLRNKLSNKIIIIQLPDSSRFETIYQNTFMNLLVNHQPLYQELSPEKNLLNFLDYNTLQAITLIDSISSNNKRVFISKENHKFYKLIDPIILNKQSANCFIDFGLDNMHPGTKSHQKIADIILSQL